jgi:(1->4)-alpha-D-glucan 1-alpha-D-glucosylmutase
MAFIDGLYASAHFVGELEGLLHRVAPLGEAFALGQTLLKLTSPGVPDIYQGDELWDLALVDPDNRRPVDWDVRRRLMDEELKDGVASRRATAKMQLIRRALDLRARRPGPFEGSYRPLEAGPRAFAYARGDEVIAVMPVRIDGDGSVLRIPPDLQGPWRNVLTDEDVALHASAQVGVLTGTLAVALLERR